ncbi:GNAT family N-acetyltransferase [Emticicia fontis]
MKIEIIAEENLKPLIDLVLELWPDCSFEEEFENYRSIIGTENEICYLVKDHGKYIAFIHVGTRSDYVEGSIESPVAYIEGVYVKPEFQKKGIARELINTAKNWAKEKGFKQIASDTELSNTSSIDFHKKLGFTEVDRIVCFIKDL